MIDITAGRTKYTTSRDAHFSWRLPAPTYELKCFE